jgi:glycosyltransferase involved in cell wall biosynthesis
MRVLIATDAWHPQVNGVLRTLTSLERSARKLGADIRFLSPDGFPSFPLPTYPGLTLAIPAGREIARRIEAARPNAIHIATEGPIGHSVRCYCLRHGLPFTTSYTTKFPEYISARFLIPESWSYAVLRRFHAPAAVTMASTASLAGELRRRGFHKLGLWTRGVDTELFQPGSAAILDLPRPIFMNVGRIAVEKNLDAFLSLDLPGSKVVIGEGPQEAALQARYPEAYFLGAKHGGTLAAHIAAADVFVAAFPVTGPRDVIGGTEVGVLDADLRAACLAALRISRSACRAFALDHSWETSARQFLRHVEQAAASRLQASPAIVAA